MVGVLYSGVVTGKHDYRKSGRRSKSGSEGRMSIPNWSNVDTPLIGPAFPFISLVLFAGCSLDGWCIGKEWEQWFDRVTLADLKPKPWMCESSVFWLSLKLAHKPAEHWGTLGFYIPIPWLMYCRGIDGFALSLMSWIRGERIAVRDEPTPPFTLIVWTATDGMLDQIAFDVSSSVVLAVMIEIHVCSEPSGLFDTELTRPPMETLTIKRGKWILFIFIYFRFSSNASTQRIQQFRWSLGKSE
jgi:hypothetical protein